MGLIGNWVVFDAESLVLVGRVLLSLSVDIQRRFPRNMVFISSTNVELNCVLSDVLLLL